MSGPTPPGVTAKPDDAGGVGRWWVFLALAVAGTWACWLPAVALGVRFDSVVGAALLLLGLAVPGVLGVAFVYLTYDERGRADFWRRVTRPGRIGRRWLVVILVVPPGVGVLAGVVDLLLGGAGLAWGEGVTGFGADPLLILPALFFATLPPLLEELGWRGYALDRLQLTWSAASASLVLGVVWALWHLPLFFIDGSFQHDEVGFATAGFWLFMVGIVSLSFTFTWIYNHTERSVLGIILLHGWVNFTAEAIVVADATYYPLWVLLAVAVVAVWGPRTMTGADEVPRPPLPAG